ncbi:DNA polymerase III subunit delta [Fusobacterium russii]|uniref:DNA polymerase III subunit delta n=1 Tax=Fusobacterium russii TaxID=854 RepID=UPI0003A4C23D|nr:DNA polymerase III subunit delta [Fusobacterium russii]
MLYFCYGISPFLELENERIMKKINEEYKGINTKFFDCSLKEEEEFFISLQTNSIFSQKEFLILKRAEILKNSGITKIIKSIKEYNLSEKIILISYKLPMLYDKVVAEYELTKKNIETIKELGDFLDCTNTKERDKIYNYIKENLKITDKDCKQLADSLGNDYYTIKNEVDKIAVFLDGDIYSFEKIKKLISIDKEYSLKDLIENFFKTRKPLEILEYISKNKDSYMGLLYIMADELIIFLKLASLIKNGKISKDINYNVFKGLYENFSELFIGKNYRPQHPYTIFLRLNLFNIENEKFYIEKLKELLELEYKMKSGEGDIELDFSLYLMNFFNVERNKNL